MSTYQGVQERQDQERNKQTFKQVYIHTYTHVYLFAYIHLSLRNIPFFPSFHISAFVPHFYDLFIVSLFSPPSLPSPYSSLPPSSHQTSLHPNPYLDTFNTPLFSEDFLSKLPSLPPSFPTSLLLSPSSFACKVTVCRCCSQVSVWTKVYLEHIGRG